MCHPLSDYQNASPQAQVEAIANCLEFRNMDRHHSRDSIFAQQVGQILGIETGE